KLVVKSIKDSIEALKSGVTDKYKLFIVVESVQDVHRLVEGFPDIKTINLGGIKAKEGSRNISKAINLLPEEETLLDKMVEKGIEIEIRQVPGDKKLNVKNLI